MKFGIALAATTAFICTQATAQTERDLDSHEHGTAALNIALDTGAVFIELDTPWNNMVGFEHAPRTEDQHALVDNALALLNQPEQLFSFVGTKCTASEMSFENGLAESDHDEHGDDEHHDDHDDDHKDEHAEDEHHDDHDDDHKDEHAEDEHHDDHDDDHKDEHAEDEHHDDHDDDHKDEHAEDEHHDHDEDADTHSSMLASYSFNCDNVADLTIINVDFINVWSGFESLNVQLVGPSAQSLTALSPTQTRVDVKSVQ